MMAQANSQQNRFHTVSKNTEPNALVLVIETEIELLIHHIVYLMAKENAR